MNINRMQSRTNRVLLWISGLLFLIMNGCIFYQVIARYIFNAPPSWSEELARYAQIWLVAIVVGPIWEKSEHITIDFLTNKLNAKMDTIVNIAMYVIVSAFSITVLYLSIVLHLAKNPQASPALGIPMGAVYMAVPVMMGLTLFNCVIGIINSISKGYKYG